MKIEIGKYRIQIEEKEKRRALALAAAQAKALQAQEKIQKAISELQQQNKKITPYTVAKQAKVSYNTAKKYLKTSK